MPCSSIFRRRASLKQLPSRMGQTVSAGGTPANEQIEIRLGLRRRKVAPDPTTLDRFLTHDGIGMELGADPGDIAVVEDFATRHHFALTSFNAAAGTVTITGQFSRYWPICLAARSSCPAATIIRCTAAGMAG
jgi:hypothetical protein